MKSNTTLRVFTYKISQKISQTSRKKQILDDMKNTDNDDKNVNCTITFICGCVNFSKGFVSVIYVLLEDLLSVLVTCETGKLIN